MLSKQIVLKLKKSPIFNFSLSSKELFHSNFLAWLLNELITDEDGNYTNNDQFKLFWKLFCKYGELSNEFNDLTIQCDSIKREEKNIDLLFSVHDRDNNDFDIIIENKVKSIPYLDQLEDYVSKAKKGSKFILLTLHCPENLNPVDRKISLRNNAVWNVVSYLDLKNSLNDFLEETHFLSNYKKEVITDYIQLIDILLHVSEEAEIKNIDEELFNWVDETSNSIIKNLRDLRLADFYLKKKYSILAELVKNRNIISRNQVPSDNKISNLEDFSPLSVNSGFSNSNGFLDIKYKIDDNFILGIQIQANMFRLVIEGQNAEQKAIELEAKNWFDFQKIEHNGVVYPKNNGLNKYGDNFRYKYVNIPPQTTLSKLLDYIEHYIIRIHNYHHD